MLAWGPEVLIEVVGLPDIGRLYPPEGRFITFEADKERPRNPLAEDEKSC